MKTIACHTLGCKVNQYDTQAMLELFEAAGYQAVDFHGPADVYLINTCTVTGTGDAKSVRTIRRVAREHPDSAIIVAGCLAQRDSGRVAMPGVSLIIGVKNRARVVELFERAKREGALINATLDDAPWRFEPLSVRGHEGKTRATMKIQEGCDRYCAYCVIPYVRGPVRCMPLDEVSAQAQALARAGYREIVLTGIHLASYGRGMDADLLDAVERVNRQEGIARIRLGSLEPVVVTDDFVARLRALGKVCPQFHLSMQSGSEGVLRRMRRRYTPEAYFQAAQRLKSAYPDCALTTDILTGFPGETDAEALETERFVRRVGFARVHVFPYSRRKGTAADVMPGQVPEEIKQIRAARLIEIGNQLETQFVQSMVGSVQQVLFEVELDGGMAEGYTRNYVRVRAAARPGEIRPVKLAGAQGALAFGGD